MVTVESFCFLYSTVLSGVTEMQILLKVSLAFYNHIKQELGTRARFIVGRTHLVVSEPFYYNHYN